jgi:hypothetical protein
MNPRPWSSGSSVRMFCWASPACHSEWYILAKFEAVPTLTGGLTLPSRGRFKGRCAPFGPPLMSNVRPQLEMIKPAKGYKPNVVPRGERIFNFIVGLLLFVFGLAGLITGHVDLSGRRIRIADLDGRPALLMAVAFICGALVLFTSVIDHCDKRNNEHHYQTFRWLATRLSWCLAAAALISYLITGFTK